MANQKFLTASLAALAACAFLGGCASAPPPKPGPDPQVLKALSKSAHNISTYMERLAAVRQAKDKVHPHVYKKPLDPHLSRKIDFYWSGPIKPAVASIAHLLHYHFKVVGHAPTSPITVTANARQRSAFKVLENIGWQAGPNAGVVVNVRSHIVQLTYVGHGADNGKAHHDRHQ